VCVCVCVYYTGKSEVLENGSNKYNCTHEFVTFTYNLLSAGKCLLTVSCIVLW
jgi:hypothetical protein